MNPEPEMINGNRLFISGFIYYKSKTRSNRTHWDCYLLRKGECKARAVTVATVDGSFSVSKGPEDSEHAHAPNREYTEAEMLKLRLKRKAEEHPEEPPSRMLRAELSGVSSGRLSQLPERESLKKSLRTVKRKNMPVSPTSLVDLGELPDLYTKTTTGDQFLIYDSKNDEDEELDGRIIVFATKRNLELLSSSTIWFLDGTCKVAPHIFTQVFTILGIVRRNNEKGEQEVVALPFVYALVSSKETYQYEIVLRAETSTAEKYGISRCQPETAMTV